MIAGGGTGGHTFPALAIARALVARGHEPGSIELVGSKRGLEAGLLDGQGFALTLLPGRGIVRRLGPDELRANAGAVVGLVAATLRELVDLSRRRPRVVVSVGGYASFAADLAAVVLGVPLVLVDVDAVPGSVHRMFARRAAVNALSFPPVGPAPPRWVVTGTAVRQEITEVDRSPSSAARSRAVLGLPTGRRTVGVMGGSLGARRLNDATAELAGRWAERADLSLYHVTGRRDWDEMHTRAPDRSGDDGLCYRQVAFENAMAPLYEAVDLMVCRAGATTVAELTVAGVPAVLVPLPGAPGDHQTANARALVEAGAAVLVPDEECDAATLEKVLDELLTDPVRLAAMGNAARALGRPDAADRLAELVDAHAR